MIDEFDVKKNFWKVHPQFQNVDPFSTFKAESDYRDSSKFMWYLKYMYHPLSDFISMDIDERKKNIALGILNEKDFDGSYPPEDIEYLVIAFQKVVETPIDRSVRALAETIDQKIKFLDEVEYDMETCELIDRLSVNYEKQVKTLKNLMELQKVEKEVKETQAGEVLSESDLGLM